VFSMSCPVVVLDRKCVQAYIRIRIMRAFLQFQDVTFLYDGTPEPLFEKISFQADSGWMGVIGANGAGKTTLLQLAAGMLKPTGGSILKPEKTVYCPQRADFPPNLLGDFLKATAGRANVLKGRLGIEKDWFDRWPTLSYGERKRAQIAVALWQQPQLLAVDEPTNHLDMQARKLISNALARFSHVGLLVSHDRILLDSLCSRCLFVEPNRIVLRPGGFTQAVESAKNEQVFLQKQKDEKKKVYKRLEREFNRRKAQAGAERKRVSKRGLSSKDHDGREKRDRARVSGKDASDSRKQRQIKGRMTHAGQAYTDLRIQKEVTLGIWFEGSVSNRDRLLDLPAGRLQLGEQKYLEYPELLIQPTDRIALVGPNGSGKSTLIQKIVQSLHLPMEHILFMPQEIDIAESRKLLDQIRQLSPGRLGDLMSIVSRLGSRPDRLFTTELPSPGEVRKLFLALGILHHPQLILMDEPTNHMDLPSMECLEKALSECPCSLVLVSHDIVFIKNLTKMTWEIQADHEKDSDSGIFTLRKK